MESEIMSIPSGIRSLDEHIGGLKEGGLYLLAGAPGTGRLVALLQFLAEGLDHGPVGMVTAAPPERIFDEARYWGLPIEAAWKGRQFRLLSLREDFERRMTSAADPGEVYEEMGELLGSGIGRLAIFPGTPLWDTRAGTSTASRFLQWLDRSGATTLATIGANLEGSTSPATEWVVQSCAGIFGLDVEEDGVRRLTIQRISGSPADTSAILLDLEPRKGFVPATGRRQAPVRLPAAADGNLLLVNLAGEVPREVRNWVVGRYEVEEIDDTFRAVERVQEARDHFGILLVHTSRNEVGVALRAARALRRLTPAPLLLFSDEAIRATDRVRALEAGANDFLTGPLSVVELASRVEHAVIAGGRPLAEGMARSSPEPTQAAPAVILNPIEFAQEVHRSLESPDTSLFSLVHIQGRKGSPFPQTLGGVLLDTIRADDGDRVGRLGDGLGIILRGTSVAHAAAFVNRIQAKLDSREDAFEWTAYSGAADQDDLRALLREAGAAAGILSFDRTGT